MKREQLQRKCVKTLLQNQSICNGLLPVLILIITWIRDLFRTRFLMDYVVAVALYDGLTSNQRIIVKQGGSTVSALLASFVAD